MKGTCVTPCILNLHAKWRCQLEAPVVVYQWEQPQNLFPGKLGRLSIRFEQWRRGNALSQTHIESRYPSRIARSLLAILTETSRLGVVCKVCSSFTYGTLCVVCELQCEWSSYARDCMVKIEN
jgi:hypothetical protein